MIYPLCNVALKPVDHDEDVSMEVFAQETLTHLPRRGCYVDSFLRRYIPPAILIVDERVPLQLQRSSGWLEQLCNCQAQTSGNASYYFTLIRTRRQHEYDGAGLRRFGNSQKDKDLTILTSRNGRHCNAWK